MSTTPRGEDDPKIPDAASSSQPSEADQYWEAAGEPRLALLCSDLTGVPMHRSGLYPSQLASRRAALDAERCAMRRVLCKLNATFNDLQPVNFLPSEVLTHIFLFTVDACSKRSGRFALPWAPDYVSLRWLGLTRVCKRWRAEALACPSLWSRIATSMHPLALKTFLQRSQDASLSVMASLYHLRNTGDLSINLSSPDVLDRTKHLTIADEGFSSVDFIEALVRPIPRLEAFTYRQQSLPGGFLDHESNVDLPKNLFSGSAPRLRRFTLQYPSGIPWFPDVYKQLQRLCIQTLPDHGFAPPPFSHIFEMLDLMPDLEDLELRHTLPTEASTPRRTAPLFFPHLRSLILEGLIRPCICILRELRVPSDCNVDLTCDGSGAPAKSIPNLINALTDMGIKEISPRSLCAVSSSKARLHIAAYEAKFYLADMHGYHVGFSPMDFGYFPRDEPTVFNLDIRGLTTVDNQSMPTHITAICSRLFSLEQLETLSIYVDMNEYNETGGPTAGVELNEMWSSVFGPCQRLREIHCAGAPAYVLLRELSMPYEPGREFPALDMLCIDGDHFSHDFLYEHVSLYDLLLHALQRRPIPHTKICEQQPFLNDDDFVALRALTDLTNFARDYTEFAAFLGVIPNDFFEFGPNVVDVDVDQAEGAQL